jgi:D-sedoheptulose 7-phosphate isomerase
MVFRNFEQTYYNSKMLDIISQELNEAQKVLQKFLSNKKNIADIEAAARLMASAIQAGNKIISCGNGGSHCDAMHFAEELSGRYRDDRRSLAAIAISDVSHLSCVSNDYGYEFVFSRFIEGLGNQEDVLLGISTSGNSGNIIKAVEADRIQEIHIKVIHILILLIEKMVIG